jgi:hypothetical protein
VARSLRLDLPMAKRAKAMRAAQQIGGNTARPRYVTGASGRRIGAS